MKMSSLDALLDSARAHRARAGERARRSRAQDVSASAARGPSIAELGTTSIVRMRDYQKARALPDELVSAICAPR